MSNYNTQLQSNNIDLQTVLQTLQTKAAGVKLPELTNEGIALDLLFGKELIDQDGKVVIGTMPNNGTITSTMDGIDVKSITIPEGYTSGGTVNLDDTIDNEVDTQADLIAQITSVLENKAAGEEQATPVISVNSNGLITATAGDKYATKQLTTQAAKTITPSTSSQTAVAEDVYTTGVVTVGAIPSQYVVPSGTLPITSNGTYDVKNYASCEVSVEGSGGSSEDSELLSSIMDGTISGFTNNTMSKVRSGLFMGCSSLSTVNMPNCTQIGQYAFESCKKLTNISFPICTTIGNNAFMNCDSLIEINLPQCTSMTMSAFTSCDSLVCINLPLCSSMANYAFNYCKVLTDVNIPSCKVLMNSVFSNCYSLSTISLPAATSIAPGVFNKCYNLKSLYLMGSSVCALSNSNAFLSTPIGGYSTSAGTYGSIFVPASMLANYKAATNWTYFSNRMVGI